MSLIKWFCCAERTRLSRSYDNMWGSQRQQLVHDNRRLGPLRYQAAEDVWVHSDDEAPMPKNAKVDGAEDTDGVVASRAVHMTLKGSYADTRVAPPAEAEYLKKLQGYRPLSLPIPSPRPQSNFK